MDPQDPSLPPAPTLAQRLFERLCQKPKHAAGTVAEAAELAAACDAIVTESTGTGLRITCLVDREANPGHRFSLDRDAVSRIGAACAKYNAPVYGGTRPPPVIQIWEIGRGPLADADRKRLSQLKPTFRVDLVAWYIDAEKLTVWSNKRFGDTARTYFERVELRHLDEPPFDLQQAAAQHLEEEEAFVRAHPPDIGPPPRTGLPFVTFGLLALFAAVFVLEQVYAVDAGEHSLGLSVPTLISLGGVSRALLARGEWWRVFTAPLLHGDIFHLLFNGLAFLMVSLFLEQLLGRAWLLALFAVGGVGGSLMSAAMQADVVSVGASGAIMGLFAGAMVASLRLPPGPHRTQVQVQLARVLVPSLLPAASSATEGKIDLAAHFGGAIAGGLLGVAILVAWRRRPLTSPLPVLARSLAAIGVILFGTGVAEAAVHYRAWAEALKLADSPEIETLNKAIDADPQTALTSAEAFLVRFPGDPRGHLLHAMLLARGEREEEGVTELHGVLDHPLALQLFDPALEARTRATLAAMLVDLDRSEEAKRVAAPVCKGNEKALELVKNMNLCP